MERTKSKKVSERPTINTTRLADAIRVRRGRKSLREAAEETGISAATLSQLENGAQPNLQTFLTLAEWIEIDLEWFYRKAA